MKYTILMSCGHEDTIELTGKGSDRERKLEYFKSDGLCKACYKKKMEEETGKEPLTFNFTVLPFIDEQDGNILLNVWFDGNTMPKKDDIKSLGDYRWGKRRSANDHFSTDRPPLCWNKCIPLDMLPAEIEKAKSIGAECITPEKGLFAMANYQIALDLHKEWEERQTKIAKIISPTVPDILKGRKWNHKIYGKSGNYSIYPDNEKVIVSDEQAAEIQEYLKQKEEYEKKIDQVSKS